MADKQYSPEQLQAYQQYIQKVQGSQQTKQEAGPKPFQPAENEDKQKLASQQISPDMQSRAPDENKNALSRAADMLRPYADRATASVGGLVKGATFGMAPNNYPGGEEAMAAHPEAAGNAALVGAGLSSLIGGKAAGGISGLAGKAIMSKLPPGIGQLLGKVFGGGEAAAPAAAEAGPVAGLGQTASEVGESVAQQGAGKLAQASGDIQEGIAGSERSGLDSDKIRGLLGKLKDIDKMKQPGAPMTRTPTMPDPRQFGLK